MQIDVNLTVNGRVRQVDVDAADTLLTLLRDRLGLLGTKEGCTEGECGACTVLLDGVPVDSCIYSAAAADGRAVQTVEGLAPPDQPLTPLQQAFVQNGAVQCGFCTPGFLMTLTALLAEDPAPEREAVKTALAGNICRCTGYRHILDAVDSVAEGER
jgi:carbon-monoxide dehydrogenase small subunit